MLKKKTTVRKKPPKKALSSRKKKGLTKDGLGQNSGLGPDLGSGLGEPSNARKEGANGERVPTSEGVNGPSVDPNVIEQDSHYERPYEYESEAFNSPVSFEDEGRTAYDASNEDTKYGEVEFKVGQLFDFKGSIHEGS
ncbi:hypothetical protein PIB30_083979 [Stylosanthes scabra]|uniref:Uncharacterized protein n=1 Tax=Stylosanthes scabra TaxID=79078 RepID=A0ABU6UR92_9FABA|nr:hypothetical protein [Stylosanthes scabra]